MKKKTKNKDLPNFWYRLFKPVLIAIFKLYYHPKFIDKENMKVNDGPIIVAGNHKHVMDQCGPIACTKRVLHYMAKKEYFDGRHAWFFKMVGCIPVNRSIKDTDAKEAALHVLEEDGAIGIFPEGTRNKTKEIMLPLKFGVVSMAKKTDATIIPFAVTGDYKFRSKNLTYCFGKPFKVTDMELEEANELLRKTIIELMEKSKKND